MSQPFPLETDDPEATQALAADLGRVASPGLVIALAGEMGAGKTTFVRGLAEGLESPDPVSSPTYTLMHAYRGRVELRHFDAWMSAREGAFLASGGAEDLLSGEVVCVLEWAEEVADLLPEDRLTLEIALVSPTERRLDARAGGPNSRAALAAWCDAISDPERSSNPTEPTSDPAVGGGR